MKSSCLLLIPLLWCSTFLPAQSWHEKGLLHPQPVEIQALFGSDLDIDGTTAILGAQRASGDSLNGMTIPISGAAFIYELNANNQWVFQQKLLASDRSSYSYFGESVAISGNVAIVGAKWESTDSTGGNILENAGAAYLYERDSTGLWVEVQKIVCSDRAVDGNFGFSVSVDGNLALIGAIGQVALDSMGYDIQYAGSAYVFQRNPLGEWVEIQQLFPTVPNWDGWFGASVHIHGQEAIIGAVKYPALNAAGVYWAASGAVYFFRENEQGSWEEVQKAGALDGRQNAYFGGAVSMNDQYAVVGAYKRSETDSSGVFMSEVGAAYVFEKDMDGNWYQAAKIVGSDLGRRHFYGESVDLHEDWIIVGCIGESRDEMGQDSLGFAGAAYLFHRNSQTGQWEQAQKIVASDRKKGFQFGEGIALGKEIAIVGAVGWRADTLDPYEGAAYTFEYTNTIGLPQPIRENPISLFPNPTDGLVQLKLPQPHQGISITIRNVIGQHIATHHFQLGEPIMLEVNNKPGLYFLELQHPSGHTTMKRVMVRK